MKSTVIATEFLISIGIVSWAAIKQGYYPWPPMVIRSAIAWSIISLAAIFDENMAVLLGSGFLLAQLVKVSTGTDSIPNWIYQDMVNSSQGKDQYGSTYKKGFSVFGLKFDGTTGVK